MTGNQEKGFTLIEVILAVTILSILIVGIGDLFLVNTKVDLLTQKKMQAGEYLSGLIEKAVNGAKAGSLPSPVTGYNPPGLPWLTVNTTLSSISTHAYDYKVEGVFQEGNTQWKLSLSRILYLP